MMAARRFRLDAFLFLVFAGLFVPLASAATANRTIDDSFGDSQTGQTVVYSPSTAGTWKDETCIGCAINPDTSQTFKGTYTAATYNPGMGSMGITMQFTGTAIYVFFVLANNQGDGITTLTEANFTIDGGAPKFFQHTPDLTTFDIQYNQLVFSQTNLPNTAHTLAITTSGVNTDVYVCFDYAIYTHVDVVATPASISSSSSSSSSSSTSSTSSSTPSSSSNSSSSSSSTSSSSTTSSAQTTGSGTPTSVSSASSLSGTSGSSSSVSSPGSTGSSNASANQDASSSTKSHSSTAAIVGGAVGGLAVALVIVFLLFLFCRRRKQRLSRSDISAPMVETASDNQREHQAAVISPFIHTSAQSVNTSTASRFGLASAGYDRLPAAMTESSVPSGHTTMPSMYTMPSTYSAPSAARSDNESAYGGYVAPSSSGSNTSPNTARATQLVLVSSSEHLLSNDGSTSPPPAHPLGGIEATRRARQIELDKRLQEVQQEMMELHSDVGSGEKGPRHRSVRRIRASQIPGATGEVGADEEMSMSDMREQMRRMREQIAFLQDQQRSAWAQGLTDDPPPGYTPEISS